MRPMVGGSGREVQGHILNVRPHSRNCGMYANTSLAETADYIAHYIELKGDGVREIP